jgi:hypothetical protein
MPSDLRHHGSVQYSERGSRSSSIKVLPHRRVRSTVAEDEGWRSPARKVLDCGLIREAVTREGVVVHMIFTERRVEPATSTKGQEAEGSWPTRHLATPMGSTRGGRGS